MSCFILTTSNAVILMLRKKIIEAESSDCISVTLADSCSINFHEKYPGVFVALFLSAYKYILQLHNIEDKDKKDL